MKFVEIWIFGVANDRTPSSTMTVISKPFPLHTRARTCLIVCNLCAPREEMLILGQLPALLRVVVRLDGDNLRREVGELRGHIQVVVELGIVPYVEVLDAVRQLLDNGFDQVRAVAHRHTRRNEVLATCFRLLIVQKLLQTFFFRVANALIVGQHLHKTVRAQRLRHFNRHRLVRELVGEYLRAHLTLCADAGRRVHRDCAASAKLSDIHFLLGGTYANTTKLNQIRKYPEVTSCPLKRFSYYCQ